MQISWLKDDMIDEMRRLAIERKHIRDLLGNITRMYPVYQYVTDNALRIYSIAVYEWAYELLEEERRTLHNINLALWLRKNKGWTWAQIRAPGLRMVRPTANADVKAHSVPKRRKRPYLPYCRLFNISKAYLQFRVDDFSISGVILYSLRCHVRMTDWYVLTLYSLDLVKVVLQHYASENCPSLHVPTPQHSLAPQMIGRASKTGITIVHPKSQIPHLHVMWESRHQIMTLHRTISSSHHQKASRRSVRHRLPIYTSASESKTSIC